MLRMSMVVIPTMAICGLLVAASSARVDQERGTGHDDENTKVCTNKTLQGEYGFTIEGEILGPGLQFRGVVMQHYDGKGSFTQVDHVVFNGVPPTEEWTPGSGTYTVNPNCTGSAVINVPGNSAFSDKLALRGGQTRQGNPTSGRRKRGHRSRQQSRVNVDKNQLRPRP